MRRKLFREEILLFEQPSPSMFSVTRKEDHLVAVKIFNSLAVVPLEKTKAVRIDG
jgi:hypothetical protein